METEKRIQMAKKLAEKTNGRVWTKNNLVRVYDNGFAIITDNGKVNINACKGKFFDTVRVACDDLGIEYGRTV